MDVGWCEGCWTDGLFNIPVKEGELQIEVKDRRFVIVLGDQSS